MNKNLDLISKPEIKWTKISISSRTLRLSEQIFVLVSRKEEGRKQNLDLVSKVKICISSPSVWKPLRLLRMKLKTLIGENFYWSKQSESNGIIFLPLVGNCRDGIGHPINSQRSDGSWPFVCGDVFTKGPKRNTPCCWMLMRIKMMVAAPEGGRVAL